MPHSNIEQLWTSVKLPKLKHIDLSYCMHLSKIEDLSSSPNLESLILEGCTNLSEISSSIRFLNKLVILNLRYCKNLHSLPSGFHLESLKKLILSCCTNLKPYPEISFTIEELYLEETAIDELPPSIENLTKLVILNLKGCSMLESLPSNICKLNSVEHLDLSGCSKLDGLPDKLGNLETLKVLKAERLAKCEVPSSVVYLHYLKELNLTDCCISQLPESLGKLSSLESLLLGRNYFESLPTSITDLSKLFYLDLSHCGCLKSLPELPNNLRNIDAHNCTLLEASSSLSILLAKSLSIRQTLFPSSNLRKKRFNFSNCFKLDGDAIKETVEDAFNKIDNITQRYSKRRLSNTCICFPGNEFPEWLTFQSRESSITVEFSRLGSFVLCAIVEFQNYRNDGQGLEVGFHCMLRSEIDEEYPHHITSIDTNFGETVEFCHGLEGWNNGNGPDRVDSDHVFIGFDFHGGVVHKKLGRMRSAGVKNYNMTLQFYVENLNSERVACCNVKSCGVHLFY